MTPYVSVVRYTKPDEDENSVFIRISHPSTEDAASAVVDIELTPVQQILLAGGLLEGFDLNRIENG